MGMGSENYGPARQVHWWQDWHVWTALSMAAALIITYLTTADIPPEVLRWIVIPLNVVLIISNVVQAVWFNRQSVIPPGRPRQ